MTVIIRKLEKIMGDFVEIPTYEPHWESLTKEKREKADLLDNQLRIKVGKINQDYLRLSDLIKKNELEKWKWLGMMLNNILEHTDYLEMADIDSNIIWPAIGQYLRTELKRGFDTKRSGTKKDHYRKCSLLARFADQEWIPSWSGWDSFVDRGDQLVSNKKFIPFIGQELKHMNLKLNSRDCQKVAKLIVEFIPSGTKQSIDIDSMTDERIRGIVQNALKKFIEKVDH